MSQTSFIVFLALVGASFGSVIPEDGWAGRVVGGTEATPGQFPWQVSLRTWPLNSHNCGGSIINDRWALSAAHCTIRSTGSNLRIVVGAHSRTSGGTTHTLSRIINHPNYNANTIRNDVSLLQTEIPMIFSRTVNMIPLSSSNIQTVDARVSGWGRTSSTGPLATNLLFVDKRTLTNEVCRTQHTSQNSAIVFDSSICAVGLNGGAVCNGDSGGPLVTNGQQVGIVSWGIPCARGFPDVYARVPYFYDWIWANAR